MALDGIGQLQCLDSVAIRRCAFVGNCVRDHQMGVGGGVFGDDIECVH